MKRIILTGMLIFLASTSAFAINNFYIDGFGTSVMNTDARHQFGGGYNLGYNLLDNLNLVHRGIFTSRESTSHPDYNYKAFYAGAEYIWYFWDRLGLRSGIFAGMSMVDANWIGSKPAWWPDTGNSDIKDSGISLLINTGIQYNITQHIAAFLDIGFHYDIFSKDFEEAAVYGESIMVGVRVTIGKNRRIDDGY